MTLSLRTMLAIGLVLTVAVPAGVGAGGWLVAGDWQARQELAQRDAALKAIRSEPLETEAQRQALAHRLSGLGVEAELSPADPKLALGIDDLKRSAGAPAKTPGISTVNPKLRDPTTAVTTPGLDAVVQGPDGKRRLTADFTGTAVELPGVSGTLFVPHGSAALRWAIAVASGALGLALVVALTITLLTRWIVRPLARLAHDADRIAGGDLAIGDQQRTPTREVAQVGEALHGMARGLRSALGASAEAERERRFLVSAIAHDLRTPLFTLRGSLEAIERGLGDGEALARAQRKAAHLDRLVGDLFAFSHAEYAQTVAEPVDLAAVALRAAETVAPGAVRLDVRGDGTATGDAVAIQRVLTNLIDNAVRHARSWVEVIVERGRVTVSDDGPGFAVDDLPRVFEPLFRGDKARSHGGAGLGLAIARRLVEAQGGDVEAGNRDAGGACVTVRLPAPVSRHPGPGVAMARASADA